VTLNYLRKKTYNLAVTLQCSLNFGPAGIFANLFSREKHLKSFRMKDLERKDLELLSIHSDINEKELQQSLEEYIYPKQDTWAKFIQITLLTLGVGFMAAGIVFFFAYNWDNLDKFVKLGIVQGLVVLATVLSLTLKTNKLFKDIILTAASLLVGVMFAVFGQVYQTGANAYDFFLAWTIFISLWVWISNFPPLWLLYLGLWNLTIFLYYEQVVRHWDFIYLSSGLFILNAAFLLACIWINEKGKGKVPTYFTNIIALGAAVWSIFSNINWIFNDHYQDMPIILSSTLLFYGLGLWYGYQRRNLFYLGVIPFSMIIIIVGGLLKINEEGSMFLAVSLFIVVSVSLVIWNLVKMQRRYKHGK